MPEEKPDRQEKIKEIMAGIETGIRDLFESGKLEAYLKAMSKFHRYSLNNTILIWTQCPTATYCAGFQTWKNEFGRHVKKGEKGIKILAPAPFKKTVQVKKMDPVTHTPVRDAGGQIVTEEQTIRIPRYKTVTVFDLSQTDGPPLPELAAELTGDVQQYDAFMEALRRTSPVPVEIKPIQGDIDGFFSRKTQSITLREGMSQIQTICAAVHECAHAILDQRRREEGGEKDTDESKTIMNMDKREEEVTAESCSCAVCAYFGIETSANSFGYIASWSKDKTLPELRGCLQIIMETTDKLITEIDRHFAEVCREREIAVPKRLEVKTGQTRSKSANAYPMPDASMPADALTAVGCHDGDLLPLSAERACALMDMNMSVYVVQTGENPFMAFDKDEILDQPEGTVFAVPREEWEASAEFQETNRTARQHENRSGQKRSARKKSAGKGR